MDSELIKLNLYSDGSTYLYRDNYEYTSITKPVLNFNIENNLTGTVYISGSDGTTFISSSEGNAERYTSFTLECEAIFPKKQEKYQVGYFTPPVTSSIVGFHRAKTASPADLAFHPSADTTLRLYAIKTDQDSTNVKFRLTGSSIKLESSLYTDVYDNNKWNFAIRVKHSKHPYAVVPLGQ